jgi:hypothetical protein
MSIMRKYVGDVLEFHLGASGQSHVTLSVPDEHQPQFGQYFLVDAPDDPAPTTLFPSVIGRNACAFPPPYPTHWRLGTRVSVRGPLGRGFELRDLGQNIAVVVLGATIARMMPTLITLIEQGREVALFTDAPIHALPAAVEISPLTAFPDAHPWADEVLADVPLETLDAFRKMVHRGMRGQVLVSTAMPCGGVAECGVCAVHHGGKKWSMACKRGPVYPLRELLGK